MIDKVIIMGYAKAIWAILLLAAAFAETKEIRAAWVDTSECPTEEATANLARTLHENGINRVYVDGWQNGKVFFPSKTMENAIGSQGVGQMIIPWFIIYGKLQYGMEVYGWYEFGYIAAMSTIHIPFGEYALKKGWVMGECDSFYYMDPRSGATEFLAGILSDGLEAGLDGVQVDDHFACPPKFEQCSADVLMQAAEYISGKLREKHGTNKKLSIAPAPMPEAIRDYRVDWRGMMRKGYFDEVVPLLYTENFDWFKNRLIQHERYWQEYKDKVVIGVMINGDGQVAVTSWEDAVKMFHAANERGYGVVVWYAKSVAIDYRKEFHELWGKSL